MSRSQIASCPCCGGRIPFKKFVLLNNFSVTNCDTCNTRIEISNRSANAVIAAISGVVSATAIVMGAYLGQKNYQSLAGGLCSGIMLAVLILICICNYAYRHSELNQIQLD